MAAENGDQSEGRGRRSRSTVRAADLLVAINQIGSRLDRLERSVDDLRDGQVKLEAQQREVAQLRLAPPEPAPVSQRAEVTAEARGAPPERPSVPIPTIPRPGGTGGMATFAPFGGVSVSATPGGPPPPEPLPAEPTAVGTEPIAEPTSAPSPSRVRQAAADAGAAAAAILDPGPRPEREPAARPRGPSPAKSAQPAHIPLGMAAGVHPVDEAREHAEISEADGDGPGLPPPMMPDEPDPYAEEPVGLGWPSAPPAVPAAPPRPSTERPVTDGPAPVAMGEDVDDGADGLAPAPVAAPTGRAETMGVEGEILAPLDQSEAPDTQTIGQAEPPAHDAYPPWRPDDRYPSDDETGAHPTTEATETPAEPTAEPLRAERPHAAPPDDDDDGTTAEDVGPRESARRRFRRRRRRQMDEDWEAELETKGARVDAAHRTPSADVPEPTEAPPPAEPEAPPSTRSRLGAGLRALNQRSRPSQSELEAEDRRSRYGDALPSDTDAPANRDAREVHRRSSMIAGAMVAVLLLGLLGYGAYTVWQFLGAPPLLPESVRAVFDRDDSDVAATEDAGDVAVPPPPDDVEIVTPSAPPAISQVPPIPSALPPRQSEPESQTAPRRPGLADRAPLPSTASQAVRDTAARAQTGDPEAQFQLGALYAEGQQVRQDYELAAFWFERAAINGSSAGAYNLGVLTQRGLGVAQNSVRAFDLFLDAAQGGHPDAQNAVGVAYALGRGTTANPIQAAQWFQAAYDSGNPRGAFNLGQLFEGGLNGPPDLEAARGWYRVAADLGSQDAVAALERLGAAPPPQTAPATSPTAAAPQAATGQAAAPAAPAPAVSLSASEVREVQLLLTILGYQPGPIDGVLGGQTEQAIRGFQRDQGLTVTGVPTQQLIDRLRIASVSG